MVSLVLYWLSVKAKGRALRVLAGISTWRIQYEDLGRFLAAMSVAAVLCGGVAAIYVGLAHGWVFVPYYTWALLTFDAVVFGATMVCAVAMSVASWPSARMIAARTPAVKSLRATSTVLKAATFALVLFAVAPAFAAYANARTAAGEQAKWRALADQVALSFDMGMGETGFQQLMTNVGGVVKDAEERNAVGLSYTWTDESTNGALAPFDYLALVNQRWLDLMLDERRAGGNRGGQKEPGLRPLSQNEVPDGVRQFFGVQLPLWTRDDLTGTEALSRLSFYRYSAPDALPLARAGGGDNLVFSNDALIVVVPSVYDLFNDDFLASVASTRNLVFTGLGQTQTLVAQHGLQNKVYVKYVAEEGVLRAQLAAYFAWLQGISIVALAVALVVAGLVGAFITAVLKARRDFPLRLAGKRWAEILADRVAREWAVGVALIGLVILIQGLEGAALVAVVAVAGLLLSPLTHLLAARWAFANVSRRRL